MTYCFLTVMRQKYGFRRLTKQVFNIKQWLGYDLIRGSGNDVYRLYRSMVTVQRPRIQETFEEAVLRNGLTERDLAARYQSLQRSTYLYGTLCLASLIYAGFAGHRYGPARLLVGLVFSFVLFAFYFRESFWLMQLRHRRLGHRFRDWLSYAVDFSQ